MKIPYHQMKIVITTWLILLTTAKVAGQGLIYWYTFGNGYNRELELADQAFGCILRGCFDGLRRSEFMDKKTECNEKQIQQQIIALRLENYKMSEEYGGFAYEIDIPDLTFYGTFYSKSGSREDKLFQIKLELKYKKGWLVAKKITYIDKDFKLPDTGETIYKYKPFDDSKGNIPPLPEEILSHYGIRRDRFNLCPGCMEKKVIKIDQNGSVWLKETYQYEHIYRLANEQLMVKKDKLWGVTNYENEVLVPIIYDKIEAMYSGGFKVFKGDKVGLYYSDKLIFPVIYQDIEDHTVEEEEDKYKGIFIVKKDNLYGVTDYKGQIIIPLQYEKIDLFYSRFFKFKKNGLYGILDVDGKVLYEPIYKAIDFWSAAIKLHAWMMMTNAKDEKEFIIFLEQNEKKMEKKILLD